jgi:acetate kinase
MGVNAATSVLTVNAGSSSLRFAWFSSAGQKALTGKFERIGQPDAILNLAGESRPMPALSGHPGCLPALVGILQERGFGHPGTVAHRVVHGGPDHFSPTRVTPQFLSGLRAIESFAPNHLPGAIALMDASLRQWEDVPQIACFDTAFHRDLPVPARLLPVPRRYVARGVRRYGFHGLSFASVLAQLRERGDLPARLLLAHLGHGASLAAVRDGRCVDTTMGFTPAAGLVMSTRCGDLDPGVLTYIASQDGLAPAALEKLCAGESGLLGLSETSGDTRDLLAAEAQDSRAAEALAVFVHQARKHLGACVAVLGGLDALVFSGGIGENSAVIRGRICGNFDFLGLHLDPARNAAGAPVISRPGSPVTVHLIPADEESALHEAALACPPA